MKKLIITISSILFLFSCEKKADFNLAYLQADSSTYSFIKFINAYPYATPVFAGQTSASVQLSNNGEQFSATPITLGSSFPASTDYAALRRNIAGYNMNVRLALGTPPAAVKDSLLFTINKPFANKYYSLFFCDSINKPNTMLITEDDIRLPGGPNLYRVRFVNLIPNPPVSTPAIDVYSTLSNAVIFTGIRFKQATSFIELPRNSIATTYTDTYQIRWAGTTTVIGSQAVQLNNQMSVTLFARGFVGATGTRAPGLSSYRNR